MTPTFPISGSGGGAQSAPDGIANIVQRRAVQAALKDVHPHTFRHTFAHQWRVNGGIDSDLMAFGGWRSPQMLQRYGASAAAQRAREAHRRLSPGDRY